MRAIAVLAFVASGLVVACATGTYGPGDSTSVHGDGGIISKGDSGSTHSGNDGGTTQQGDDSGTTTQTCDGTMCGTDCVDTSSDPNNCGSCGTVCDTSSTCVGGQCTSTTTTSNEPPQGTCGHSLCTAGSYLDEGCDPAGCNIVICDPSYLDDEFCCSGGWDSTCVDEVNTYCSPYSCN